MLYEWAKWATTGTCEWDAETQEALQAEYAELIKDDNQTYIENLRRDLIVGDLEIQQVTAILEHLRNDPNEELIEILQSDPYYISADFSNIPAAIDRIKAQYKSKLIKLKLKEKEYLQHMDKQPKQGASTMQDWASQLRVLSKWMATQLNWHTLSVLEYTVYLNDFKAENKRNEPTG